MKIGPSILRGVVMVLLGGAALAGCDARDKLLAKRQKPAPGLCQVHDCTRSEGTWTITTTRKKGSQVLGSSQRNVSGLCREHAENVMNGYDLTSNHAAVSEVHWLRYIFANLLIGGLVGLVGFGMLLGGADKLTGRSEAMGRATPVVAILCILIGYGVALFVGWSKS